MVVEIIRRGEVNGRPYTVWQGDLGTGDIRYDCTWDWDGLAVQPEILDYDSAEVAEQEFRNEEVAP